MRELGAGTLLLILAACAPEPAPAPAALKPPPSEAIPAPRALLRGPFRIEFRDIQKNRLADPPVPGQALVTILKSDLEAGAVSWSAVHFEGDPIGRPKGQSTYRHLAFSKSLGKHVEVDFNTGLAIEEITPNQVVGDQSATFVADQVVFRLPDGSWNWIHLTDGPDVVAERGPGPLSVGKRPSAEVLYLADQDWKSRNPKIRRRAQESYRLLLKEYSDDRVVKPERDRIRARAEAIVED